jgi:hypothetical protein
VSTDERVVGLTSRGVAKLLHRLGVASGVGHVRPHGLRHACISEALSAGESVRRVRAFSRHARLDTLLRYDDNRARGADAEDGNIADALGSTQSRQSAWAVSHEHFTVECMLVEKALLDGHGHINVPLEGHKTTVAVEISVDQHRIRG